MVAQRKELYSLSQAGKMMAAPVKTSTAFDPGVRSLCSMCVSRASHLTAVAPDGRLLVNTPRAVGQRARRSHHRRPQLARQAEIILDIGTALEPPLSPAAFFTLFALASGDKHGYAIMQNARRLSDGRFRMGPAALYTTLQKLLDLELIVELPAGDEDARRRTYRLNRAGRALLDAELARLDALLRKAGAIDWKPVKVKP